MRSEIEDVYARVLSDERDNLSNFSKWYPVCTATPELAVPKSTVVTVPESVITAMWSDAFYQKPEIHAIIEDFVNEQIRPLMQPGRLYFVKNSMFSNKFNFNSCVTTSDKVLYSFIDINYAAMCVGAEGLSEFVIREYINSEPSTLKIYNGMPLHPEFRCFWSPKEQRCLYSTNYWDSKYVSANLYDATDKLVFSYTADSLEREFNNQQQYVEKVVTQALLGKSFPTARPWSVDVMMQEDGTLWLIDMAVAESSTYWDPSRIRPVD